MKVDFYVCFTRSSASFRKRALVLYVSQLQFLTLHVRVAYKDKSDSGNALHAFCLLVGHWLADMYFINVKYFKIFVKKIVTSLE